MNRAITVERMATVFREWQRRHREEPEAFARAWDIAGWSLEDYGDRAAAYFAALAAELEEDDDG